MRSYNRASSPTASELQMIFTAKARPSEVDGRVIAGCVVPAGAKV